MIHSLRFRLLLITAAVAGVALVAATLTTRVVVHREFERFELSGRSRDLAGLAQLLAERLSSVEGPEARDSVLAALAASVDRDLVLADRDRVIAASTPALRRAEIRPAADGAVLISLRTRRGAATVLRRALILGHSAPEVSTAGGRKLGRLYLLPREPAPGEVPEPGFLPAVNRWLLIGLLGSGLLAVLLVLALSRRILGPVEELTRAVRRMEAGDLGHRVTVRSHDEIAELARAYNSMAASLERNEALRRGLVTDVAHELRTPLTNLRCQIEAIQDGLLTADEGAIRSLYEETLLLSRLVDDLQELAVAEAGGLALDRTAVPVGPVLEAALAAVGAQAAERGVRLRSEVAPGTPDLDADPGRLAQILRNLLANALAHTPAGGSVTVSAAARDSAVAIAVADTGSGIGPRHLPHVFDRFYRADPSRARSSGGAGLGLAIVRQLVEAHGGTVRVESEPGHGAVFTFVLPAARAPS